MQKIYRQEFYLYGAFALLADVDENSNRRRFVMRVKILRDCRVRVTKPTCYSCLISVASHVYGEKVTVAGFSLNTLAFLNRQFVGLKFFSREVNIRPANSHSRIIVVGFDAASAAFLYNLTRLEYVAKCFTCAILNSCEKNSLRETVASVTPT